MNKLSFIMILFFLSCQNGINVDTTKHTATDPIADITYLNGFFYTTNIDASGNAGSQIDLYKFEESIPIDRYPMELNGQGYMAAANDGSNLYFQPRFTDYIFKSTPLGEIFWYQPDNFSDNTSDTTSTFMYWRGRGLAWADSNLVVFYRHKDDSTLYRGRYLHIDNDNFQTVLDTTVIWNHLNSNGAYAMEYKPDTNGFWVLATDILNQYILFEVDANFVYNDNNNYLIIDGYPMGFAWMDGTLYLSYQERQILPE